MRDACLTTTVPHVVVLSDYGHAAGGVAQVAIIAARALAELGVRLTFVCGVAPIGSDLNHANIQVHQLGLQEVWQTRNRLNAAARGIWNDRVRRELTRILRNHDPATTIVHAHQWTKSLSPSVLHAVGQSGFELIVTAHDFFSVCPNGAYYVFGEQRRCSLTPMTRQCLVHNCDRSGRAHKVVRIVRQVMTDRALRRSAPIYIHVSPLSQKLLSALLPPGSRQFLVPNPCDVRLAPPADAAAADSFVYVGRFTVEKGCLVLAEAAKRAGVRVVFMGDGPEKANITAINPRAELRPWGSREAVSTLIEQARALVLPTLCFETFGLVAFEAVARGVPVIVSHVTGATDFVHHAQAGRIVEAGKVEELASALGSLRDADTARSCGAAAYSAYWRDPFTPERHAGALMAIYAKSRPAFASRYIG
jgi:glycosyltransferase involved in cell wall biosynthesis